MRPTGGRGTCGERHSAPITIWGGESGAESGSRESGLTTDEIALRRRLVCSLSLSVFAHRAPSRRHVRGNIPGIPLSATTICTACIEISTHSKY